MTAAPSSSRSRTRELAPGLWSLPVDVPLPGLRTVLAYAFETRDGLLLVDAGWSSSDSLASLETRLAELGASLADVRDAVFTHAHGDHYGLAGAVRDRSGCRVALHAADVPLVSGRLRGDDDGLDAWLARAAVTDAAERRAMLPGQGRFEGEFPPPLPDVELVGGGRVEAPGVELDVLHTPGHTPGHVVLLDRRAGLVVTGDAVLPRITPNVSATPHAEDPLGDYLASLDRLAGLGDVRVLPGHGRPIASVAVRAQEIAEHHEEQLRETLALVEAGAETVRDVAERMPWSRPWSALPAWERRAALGEAQAHLVVLERRGALALVGDHPLRWRAGA